MITQKLMNLHIKDRIIVMLMTISTCAVLLCMAITTVMGVYSYDLETKKALALNAQLLASRNAVALAFNNPDFSRDTLKLLKEQQNIMAGCILNKDGIFASYGEADAIRHCDGLPRDWRGFFEDKDISDAHSVIAVRNIYSEGEWVGGIVLVSNQQKIYDYLYSQLSWAILVICVVSLISFALARLLQGFVSKPIMEVISVTEHLSQEPMLTYNDGMQKGYEFNRIITAFNNIMYYANNRVRYHQLEARRYAEALQKSGESLRVMNQSLNNLDNATHAVSVLIAGRPLGNNVQNYESYIRDIRFSLEKYKSRFDAMNGIYHVYEQCAQESPVALAIVQSLRERIDALQRKKQLHPGSMRLDCDITEEGVTYMLHRAVWERLCEMVFEVMPLLRAQSGKEHILRIGYIPGDPQDRLLFELSLSAADSGWTSYEELARSVKSSATGSQDEDFFSDAALTKDDFVFIISCIRYISSIDDIEVEAFADYPFCRITLKLPSRMRNYTLSLSDEALNV